MVRALRIAIAHDASGWPIPYSRSGKTHHDRGGQLGRIRAFLGSQSSALEEILTSWPVLYAEWMMREHSVYYDALPSFLIVLDLWSPTTGFAGAEERDRRCAKAGLHVPPLLHHGIVADTAHLADLVSKSQCRSGPAEGLVLRDAVDEIDASRVRT
jgi:hypothetical protein